MNTRADIARAFRELGGGDSWKTFVIEAHADDPIELLRSAFGEESVRPTTDAYVQEIANGANLWVDHLDERYWNIHTYGRVDDAHALLRSAVNRSRVLDWMWLPSQHLRGAWPGARLTWLRSDFKGRRLLPSETGIQDLEVQLRGSEAPEILELISSRYQAAVSFDRVVMELSEREYGRIQEGVSRQGRFVARGDSFEFHQEVVRSVTRRYRQLIELVEQRMISWQELPQGGAQMDGSAIVVQFSRTIPDRELFLDQLFSAREPFRLWGIPVERNDVAEVEAVDLHVGRKLRFDVGSDWLRVYLFEGGCGNSVARLITNLQHHFDGALRLLDPELATALESANELAVL
jgi:hypothetical protein